MADAEQENRMTTSLARTPDEVNALPLEQLDVSRAELFRTDSHWA